MSQSIQGVIGASGFLDTIARATERVNQFSELAVLSPDSKKLSRGVHGTADYSAFKFPAINPRDIFCSKTGRKIGTHDESALRACFEIHGSAMLETTLLGSNLAGVASAWVWTDSKRLDILQKKDERGYVCFALGELTRRFHEKGNPHLLKRDIGHATTARYWAMARAFSIVSLMPERDLANLAIALQRAVSFLPDSSRYLGAILADLEIGGKRMSAAPDHLARLAVQGVLVDALNIALATLEGSIAEFKHAIANVRQWEPSEDRLIMKQIRVNAAHASERENYNSKFEHKAWVPARGVNGWRVLGKLKRKTYEEVPETLEDARKGPSNFRGQKKHRPMSAEEFEGFMMIFGEANTITPQTLQARMARYQQAAEQRDAERLIIAEDLEAEFDSIFNPDAVFVRTAPDFVMKQHDEFKEQTLPRVNGEDHSVPSAPRPLSQRFGRAPTSQEIPAIVPPITQPAKPSLAARFGKKG